MTQKSIITLFIALFTFYAVNAHSKTEIGIRFIEENEKTFVEVHLTSSTLFDLLYELYPYLESQESLNLSNYLSDYEIYFNEHFNIELNGQRRRLSYVDSNLITHDAMITFLVKDFDEEIYNYQMTVGGFDFYHKPSFAVLFTTASITSSHSLNKATNMCSGSSPSWSSQHEKKQFTFYSYSLAVLIGSIILLIWVARRREDLSSKSLSEMQ